MQSSSVPRPRPGQLIADAPQDGSPDRFAFGLSQADVEEFLELIHSECGEELSPEDAWNRASEVLALFRMLLGPLPEDQTTAGYQQA